MFEDKISILCLDAKGGSVVDLDVVDYLLNAMTSMSIELDKDPLGGGPTRLQNKLATVRNMLSKLERWYHIVSRADHTLGRSLLLINTELELRVKDLLANDPEVKKPSSHKDREAVAHYKLRELFAEKYRLEAGSHDTTSVLRALSQKRVDLKDMVSRLRDQVRLCQDELTLGRKWGSQVPESDLQITPEPTLAAAVAEDAEVTLAELLSENGGASVYDFEMPSRSAAEEILAKGDESQVKRTRIVPDKAPLESSLEALLAEDDKPLSATLIVEGIPEHPSPETLASSSPDLLVDSAMEEMDMDVLDQVLQEAQGGDPTDAGVTSVEDGLPADFWS